MLIDSKGYSHALLVFTAKRIAVVVYLKSQKTSLRHREQQMNFSRTSLRNKEFGLLRRCNPFKTWREVTILFVSTSLSGNQISMSFEVDYCKRVIFSDKSHFHIEVFLNKQYRGIWGSESPHWVVGMQMYVTFWWKQWNGNYNGFYISFEILMTIELQWHDIWIFVTSIVRPELG